MGLISDVSAGTMNSNKSPNAPNNKEENTPAIKKIKISKSYNTETPSLKSSLSEMAVESPFGNVELSKTVNIEKNGTHKREEYLSWDDYFMAVAFLSAQRSKDPSTQVRVLTSACAPRTCFCISYFLKDKYYLYLKGGRVHSK